MLHLFVHLEIPGKKLGVSNLGKVSQDSQTGLLRIFDCVYACPSFLSPLKLLFY